MWWELGIALRYLKVRKGQPFLSLISFISIAGVAVGVMALIITLSVMNGFQYDLRHKILGVNAHIVVLHQFGKGLEHYEQTMRLLGTNKTVAAASPFVYGQAILKANGAVSGVVVKGILPSQAMKVTNLAEYVKIGSLNALVTLPSAKKEKVSRELPQIVLGKELAQALHVALNDDVVLVSSQGVATSIGMVPLMTTFKVGGIFDSGMYEYDANLIFIPLETAQNLFGLKNKISGIDIKSANFFRAQRTARELQAQLGQPYWVRSWDAMNRNLFSALKLEKIAMFIILTLIILVACFNIIGTLMIITVQKTRCIGILRAIGATKKKIRRIFVCEGLLIGFLGLLVGMAGGFVSCLLLDKYQFIKLPGDIYYLDHLPVRMQSGDFLLVALSALIISFLATLYPSYQASRLDPVEAIRYE